VGGFDEQPIQAAVAIAAVRSQTYSARDVIDSAEDDNPAPCSTLTFFEVASIDEALVDAFIYPFCQAGASDNRGALAGLLTVGGPSRGAGGYPRPCSLTTWTFRRVRSSAADWVAPFRDWALVKTMSAIRE
jgi:hypothetical protein